GLPVDPDDIEVDLSQIDQVFIQKQFLAGFSGARGRNSYQASAFVVQREAQTGGRDDTVTGGSASFSRRLSPQMTWTLRASYSETEKDAPDTPDTERVQLGTSLGYQFNESLRGTLSYSFLDRSGGNSDLTENVVSIFLRKEF